MLHVRPGVRGLEEQELVWAPQYRNFTRCALPVNREELVDSLVLRFKMTWLERLKVLFGQDLFIWFATNSQAPQWPTPYLSDPVWTQLEFADGSPAVRKVLPYAPKKFFAHKDRLTDAGDVVPNPHSEMDMVAPAIEAELRRTVTQKINSRLIELPGDK